MVRCIHFAPPTSLIRMHEIATTSGKWPSFARQSVGFLAVIGIPTPNAKIYNEKSLPTEVSDHPHRKRLKNFFLGGPGGPFTTNPITQYSQYTPAHRAMRFTFAIRKMRRLPSQGIGDPLL